MSTEVTSWLSPSIQGLECAHPEKLHLDIKHIIPAKNWAEIHKTQVENIQY